MSKESEIQKTVNSKQVDKETGVYVAEGGEPFTTISTFSKNNGITRGPVSKSRANFRFLSGLDKSGHLCTLYSIQDMYQSVVTLISNPIVPKSSDNGRLVSTRTLAKNLDLGDKTVREALSSVDPTRARGSNGRLGSFYPYDLAMKILQEKGLVHQVNKETHIFRDEQESEWASLENIARIVGLNRGVVRTQLVDTISIRGRDQRGRIVRLYNISECKQAADEFLKLPQVESSTGIYTNEHGKKFATLWILVTLLGYSWKTIETRISNVEKLEGRDLRNRKRVLYNIEEAAGIFEYILGSPRGRRKSSSEAKISPDQADEEMRRLMEEEQ